MRRVCDACSHDNRCKREGEGEGARAYAVDVPPWPRCDAECSPERAYLYHPSRHSAGQSIVAGWAYQLVAGLSFERDSSVTPVDELGRAFVAASSTQVFGRALVGTSRGPRQRGPKEFADFLTEQSRLLPRAAPESKEGE